MKTFSNKVLTKPEAEQALLFPAGERQHGTLEASRPPVEAGQKFLVCRNLRYEWKSIV